MITQIFSKVSIFSRLCDINHTIIVKRVAEEINLKRQLKIGIVDADLIGRDKHRFPNLVCEKISAYYKEKGARVDLLLD